MSGGARGMSKPAWQMNGAAEAVGQVLVCQGCVCLDGKDAAREWGRVNLPGQDALDSAIASSQDQQIV